jgi:hypothetical protein
MGAGTIKPFRPVALINVIPKFVAKAYVLFALTRLLKLDFEKAYDWVKWDFLFARCYIARDSRV